MLSPFPYIFACLSLSLLFRQSLLYDIQFKISIHTRLISTGYEPSAFSSLESTSISFIISEAPPAIKVSHYDLVLLEPATLKFCWNRRLLLVFVTASPLPCSSGSSQHLLVFVYDFSSALCCSGLNRRLIVVPLLFPKLRSLQKHRTSSTSIGLTACPLFIGLTPCPLHFLSRLRVLYLPWAVFTPLPSCVGCVSTTSPRADTPSTISPPADCTSITPGSLEHLRSLEYCATSNSVSTIPPRIA
jgi:hypothetical protein